MSARIPFSIHRSFGFLCLAVGALALVGCASLKVTPQNYAVVGQPFNVNFDAGSDIVPNTATATIDGQNIPLTCTQYACTSQSVTGLQAGLHTLIGTVSETCTTCNPNPISLTNNLPPDTQHPNPPFPATQFVVGYSMSLSPTVLSIQQGQSGSVTLTDDPILNVASDISASGAAGVTVIPAQTSTVIPQTYLVLSVASSVAPGTYTITIQQQPPASSHTPAKSGTVMLTVTASPPTVQTGAFTQAAFTSAQTTSPNGKQVLKFALAPPVGSNAPGAPTTAQVFTTPGNQPQTPPMGFYSGGGAAFCPTSGYVAVMTPVPAGSNLGTNAQAIYFVTALPNTGSSLARYVAYTNGSGGLTGPTSLSFSPDCSVVMVKDVDPSVPSGSRPLRAQFFKVGLISPFYTVHFNSSAAASVINGGSHGEVQVTADNGTPTTFAIP